MRFRKFFGARSSRSPDLQAGDEAAMLGLARVLSQWKDRRSQVRRYLGKYHRRS